MEDCLPQNFADKLIQLESMLDEQCSIQLIHELNQLYRVKIVLPQIGIDYYVRQQPRKAMHFQKKMMILLANPKTLTIIEEPIRKNRKQDQNQNKQILVKNFKLQTKIKDQVMKFQSFSDQYIKNIMESSEKAVKKNSQLRDVDLNKQQRNLQQRIMLKKVRSQEKLKHLSPRKS